MFSKIKISYFANSSLNLAETKLYERSLIFAFQKMALVSYSNLDKGVSVAQDKFLHVSVRFVQRYSYEDFTHSAIEQNSNNRGEASVTLKGKHNKNL